MSSPEARQISFIKRPEGPVGADSFEIISRPVPEPGSRATKRKPRAATSASERAPIGLPLPPAMKRGR